MVDLAAAGVVEVLDALLSMGTFKLQISSGGIALSGQRCQVAAQVGCHLTGTVQIGPGIRKLALHLLDRCFAAIGPLRIRLSAALGRPALPFRALEKPKHQPCMGTIRASTAEANSSKFAQEIAYRIGRQTRTLGILHWDSSQGL
ncbi:hypothetical protein [Arthrobacter sp. ISL-30]|uniref:hypothetical protein n=1 Tax=Arthrobacter sp. ISL-30 TaxID=2819109 RepID=UPI001BE73EDC|nr:hypothetical protein [Arthrobacter sp. ISL-30]MBT2513173.1 hypothetical protein [Arthrobacter sp. ISL-30]